MNDNEINYIRDEMKDNISIRNKLLTFCFTSVITTIGFGLNNFDTIPYYMYIIPVFITFIFSCRITYYKDKYCKLYAYAKYLNEYMTNYEEKYKNVSVYNFCGSNRILSFVINNELLLLSIVCLAIYYIKFFEIIDLEDINILYIISFILPVITCIIQKRILNNVPSIYNRTNYYYDKLKNDSQ